MRTVLQRPIPLSWLKSRPRWFLALADEVEQLIKSPCGDAWPVTIRQITKVASRYGLFLEIRKDCPEPAMCVSNTLAVRDTGDPMTMYPRAVHELAEALIRSEHMPRNTQIDRDATLPHKLAQVVEWRYERSLEWAEYARQDEAWMKQIEGSDCRAMGPETYEPLDE